jgi:hypothetical protein
MDGPDAERSANQQPILLAICSQHANNPDPKNSELDFQLPDKIESTSQSAMCLLSVKSFNCKNSFYNISSNLENTILKCKVTYRNNITQITSSYITTLTLPNGYYNIISLVDTLNSLVVQQVALVTDFNIFFGNGSAQYPSFGYDENFNIFIYQYNDLLSQAVPIQTNEYAYISFILINDTETIGLLKLLGFLPNFVKNFNSTDQISLFCQAYNSLGETNYNLYSNYNTSNTVTTTTYITIPATYLADLQSIQMLYICVDNVISQHRNSYDNLRQTDFLLGVPLNVGYNSTFTYVDTGMIIQAYNVNLNLTTLKIKIYDQLGRLVDFRGTTWNMQIVIQFVDNSDALYKIKNPSFNRLKTQEPLSFMRDSLDPRKSVDYVKRNNKVNY